MKSSTFFAVALCLGSVGCDQISARLAALRSPPPQALGNPPTEPSKNEENPDLIARPTIKGVGAIRSDPGLVPADLAAGAARSASSASGEWKLSDSHKGVATGDGISTRGETLNHSPSASPPAPEGQQPPSINANVEISRDMLAPRVNLNDGKMAIEMDSGSIKIRSGILESGN